MPGHSNAKANLEMLRCEAASCTISLACARDFALISRSFLFLTVLLFHYHIPRYTLNMDVIKISASYSEILWPINIQFGSFNVCNFIFIKQIDYELCENCLSKLSEYQWPARSWPNERQRTIHGPKWLEFRACFCLVESLTVIFNLNSRQLVEAIWCEWTET